MPHLKNVIIYGKNFYGQAIDSDIKTFEQIRRLTTEGEDYTTGCLLDYDYIKNHYRLTAVDLSRICWTIKKLDADDNVTDETGKDQSMCPNNFRKNQRIEIKIFLRNVSIYYKRW